MQAPSMHDYVRAYFTLFERFEQDQQNPVLHRGHPFDYEMKALIFFFTLMQVRRIKGFKTQWRWLSQHPEVVIWLGFETVPVRTTLSRRYKSLYSVLQAFIAYLGQWAETLSAEFDSRVLIEDASLFKAHGPVWHQSDRQAQRVPEKLYRQARDLADKAARRRICRLPRMLFAGLGLNPRKCGQSPARPALMIARPDGLTGYRVRCTQSRSRGDHFSRKDTCVS